MKKFLCAVSCLLPTALTLGAYVQLDISSALNYDIVGTSSEIGILSRNGTWPVTYTLNGTLTGGLTDMGAGDHRMKSNQGFGYTTVSSAPGEVAIPDNGVIGKYQLSTNFDNGTDYLSTSPNSLLLFANNNTPSVSQTITLEAGQQAKYSAFNMAFVTYLGASSSSYRAWVTANYTDASSAIVVDTGLQASSTFGVNGFEKRTDATTFVNQAPGTGETIGVSNILASTAYLAFAGSSGSTQYNLITTTTSRGNMYEFDTDIALDPTKVLESLTIDIQRGGVSRNQELYVFAISAAPVPEPATIALLMGLGALGIVLWRRRK